MNHDEMRMQYLRKPNPQRHVHAELMAQYAELTMQYAELMAQYAEDALTHERPWELWEVKLKGASVGWYFPLHDHPKWGDEKDYRRKPKQHTITLNEKQLKEILEACEYPSWENAMRDWDSEDFTSGVQVLNAALRGAE